MRGLSLVDLSNHLFRFYAVLHQVMSIGIDDGSGRLGCVDDTSGCLSILPTWPSGDGQGATTRSHRRA